MAGETGTLFSAGIGTTNLFDPESEEVKKKCEALLRVSDLYTRIFMYKCAGGEK